MEEGIDHKYEGDENATEQEPEQLGDPVPNTKIQCPNCGYFVVIPVFDAQ